MVLYQNWQIMDATLTPKLPMDRFPSRKLLVYSKAVDLAVEVTRLSDLIPRDHLDLRWQLRRAARSVVLNIAEGAGEFSPREKARIYRIARRSAWETLAALDLCVRSGFFTMDDVGIAVQQIDEVTAMLTTMAKRAEQRIPRRRPTDERA
jgi:four helix bundle protein